MPLKDCPPGKIRNPKTGRCVKKDGAIGKKLARSSPKRSSPKRSSPKRSSPKRSSPKPLKIYGKPRISESRSAEMPPEIVATILGYANETKKIPLLSKKYKEFHHKLGIANVSDGKLLYLFQKACKAGKLDYVKYIVSLNRVNNELNDIENLGPALAMAGEYGHLNIIEYLIDTFPNAERFCTYPNVSPIVYATAHNHIDILKYLIGRLPDRSTYINYQFIDKTLTYAINLKINNVNAVEYFLRAYAINLRMYMNSTGIALLFKEACIHNNLGIAKLIKRLTWVDMNTGHFNALEVACEKGYLDIVEYLLALVEFHPLTHLSISLASKNGHLGIVKTLINAQGGSRDFINFGLKDAAGAGHVDIVKYLLKLPKASINFDHNRPLLNACWYGHLDVVKLLVNDPRVDARSDNDAPIKRAHSRGHTDIVNYLASFIGLNKEQLDAIISGKKAMKKKVGKE